MGKCAVLSSNSNPGVSHKACWWSTKHGTRIFCNVVPGSDDLVIRASRNFSTRFNANRSRKCPIRVPRLINPAIKISVNVLFPIFAAPITYGSRPFKCSHISPANSLIPPTSCILSLSSEHRYTPAGCISPQRRKKYDFNCSIFLSSKT